MTTTRFLGAALCASIIAAAPATGSAQPAKREVVKIRAFSPEKTQALGRAMYIQDQAAWQATDLMLAANPDRSGMLGWVATPYNGGQRVRFIKGSSQGPQAAYEVVFDGRNQPTFQVSSEPALTADEVAQRRAFETAAHSGANICGSRPPNHIEIRDPDTGEWLVWILSPSTDEGWAMGGHTRVTVSADGSKVVRKEEMARSCLTMKHQRPQADMQPAMMVVSQLVADRPLETHLFTALTARVPVGVVMPDKSFWTVDGKTITNNGSIDDLKGLTAPPRSGS